MIERRCPECGAAFVSRYRQQVCCSEKCKKTRMKKLQAKSHAALWQRKAKATKRLSKAERRKAFFEARDAAFERAGLPIPRIVVRDGVRTEFRGYGFGSRA